MSDSEATLWKPPGDSQVARADAVEALKAVPLFAGLKDAALRKVLRILHERTYKAGEVIFREGEPGNGMYIVRKGAVRIVIRMPDGSEKQLAQLTERQFFGEMALLEQAPRSASAVAAEPTQLLGFFVPDLENLIERDAALGSQVLWKLAWLMAIRLRTMNETLRAERSAVDTDRERPE
jgi:CRP-like cAMP-binding protein